MARRPRVEPEGIDWDLHERMKQQLLDKYRSEGSLAPSESPDIEVKTPGLGMQGGKAGGFWYNKGGSVKKPTQGPRPKRYQAGGTVDAPRRLPPRNEQTRTEAYDPRVDDPNLPPGRPAVPVRPPPPLRPDPRLTGPPSDYNRANPEVPPSRTYPTVPSRDYRANPEVPPSRTYPTVPYRGSATEPLLGYNKGGRVMKHGSPSRIYSGGGKVVK
jgi:hypothetical protein